MQKNVIVVVGDIGHIAAEARAIQTLAIVAVAESERIPAVIRSRIAEGVEEAAVDIVSIQSLAENFERLLLVPSTVDAGLVKAVVDCRLTVRPLEKPFRMGIVNVLVRLAEIPAANHADLAGMRLANHFAKCVMPLRQV